MRVQTLDVRCGIVAASMCPPRYRSATAYCILGPLCTLPRQTTSRMLPTYSEVVKVSWLISNSEYEMHLHLVYNWPEFISIIGHAWLWLGHLFPLVFVWGTVSWFINTTQLQWAKRVKRFCKYRDDICMCHCSDPERLTRNLHQTTPPYPQCPLQFTK